MRDDTNFKQGTLLDSDTLLVINSTQRAVSDTGEPRKVKSFSIWSSKQRRALICLPFIRIHTRIRI